MDGTFNVSIQSEKCIHNFSWKIAREETASET
jgi:hypothetical protein